MNIIMTEGFCDLYYKFYVRSEVYLSLEDCRKMECFKTETNVENFMKI